MHRIICTGLCVIATTLGSLAAQGAELRVFCAIGLRAICNAIAPQFEAISGHKLMMEIDLATRLKQKIDAGEAFDLALMTPQVMDELINQGKVRPQSRAEIARTAAAIAVRVGVPKPNLTTLESTKTALLNAKSIAYFEPSLAASGAYYVALLRRLGIEDQLQSKTKLLCQSVFPFDLAAAGEVEFGVALVSEIVPVPGIEAVPFLPAEKQSYVGYAAAIGATAKEAEGAQSLINFFRSPKAAEILKSKGMEPG
jgi:molybdate transport system substrate-binding protein